jgi:hypothetical protein
MEDIEDFAYNIQDDIVVIHCHVKDVTFEIEPEQVRDNRVLFSWSVPVKEIKGLENPTDYLKRAIADANQ